MIKVLVQKNKHGELGQNKDHKKVTKIAETTTSQSIARANESVEH